MPLRAGHGTCRGLRYAVWLWCVWSGLAAAGKAQVFEVQGGASSLYDATGGSLKVYTPNYEGRIGLGLADGWKAGGSLRTERFGHVFLLGDDMIRTELPTDVFGGNRYAFARGLSVGRKGKRGGMYGFAGVSSDIFATPFFQAGEADRLLGVLMGDYLVKPDLRAFTRNSFARDIHSLHGVEWQATEEYTTSVAGGAMMNAPYLASSFSAEKPWLSLKSSYVLAAKPRARRVIATTDGSAGSAGDTSISNTPSSEANKENIVVSFRVGPSLTLSGGRQNFLQASFGDDPALTASVNHAGFNASLGRFQIGGNVYDSRVRGLRNLGTAFSALFPLTDQIRVMGNYFRSSPSGSKAFNTFSLSVHEAVTPYLALTQLLTQTDGRTSVSFGGSLQTNLVKISADWQTFFVPLRQGNQFKQALVLRFDLRLPGNMQLQIGTDVAPDGSVHYTTYGRSFLYHQGMGGMQGPTFSFPKYLLRGKVFDDKGSPFAGAALLIGDEGTLTDSNGKFFLRVRKAGPHALTVDLENFMAPGKYEVVSAPEEVTATREDEPGQEIEVVLRRLANGPAGSAGLEAAPAGRLEGTVKLRTLSGTKPAADVWVITDAGESAKTDTNGRFEVAISAAGRLLVSIDPKRVPANLRPGETSAVSTMIRNGETSRVELEVVPVQTLAGMVADLAGKPVPKGMVLRLLPKGDYTTASESGTFVFYGVPEGDYEIQLVENSLAQGARMVSSSKVAVRVRHGVTPAPVHFRYKTGATDVEPQKDLIRRPNRAVLYSTGSEKKQPVSGSRVITRTGRE